MNYNTLRLSQLVNDNINQRRRSVGKGSRETQYRNLIKTSTDTINDVLRNIQRHRVGQTYGEVWNLNVGKTGLKTNKIHLQSLATILARKSSGAPAITIVADFITFILMHHNIPLDVKPVVATPARDTGGGGAAATVTEPVTVEPVPATMVQNDDDELDWESFADEIL